MSMYKKVDTSLNFVEREKQVVDYWNENHIFEDSVKMNEGKEEFSFYDPSEQLSNVKTNVKPASTDTTPVNFFIKNLFIKNLPIIIS